MTHFKISDLQDFKIIHLCCLKPLNLWWFDTVAIGSLPVTPVCPLNLRLREWACMLSTSSSLQVGKWETQWNGTSCAKHTVNHQWLCWAKDPMFLTALHVSVTPLLTVPPALFCFPFFCVFTFPCCLNSFICLTQKHFWDERIWLSVIHILVWISR